MGGVPVGGVESDQSEMTHPVTAQSKEPKSSRSNLWWAVLPPLLVTKLSRGLIDTSRRFIHHHPPPGLRALAPTMKAPRRVPWASRSQLEELYDYLFSPASDLASRQRGLCRVSLGRCLSQHHDHPPLTIQINVYLSSPSCPAFLPLLHGLINASLLPPPTSAGEAMTTRMTCAMAIVRFVNGMVDPLQVGAYARPISHLAATIGIPPILIAIRHRATHDDLPPLPLLLSSVNMAVDYLHHYAFLPLLASSSDMAANGIVGPSTRRSEGLIRRWKKAMKTRVRDKVAGEENETGREIRKVKRDIEVVDPEDVIAALCTVDGLIPLARR